MDMLPMKKEAAGPGGRKSVEKLELRVDAITLSRLQSSQFVNLRVLCENGSMVSFLLRNMKAAGSEGSALTVDMNAGTDSFPDMMNPELKVIFKYENIIAPFAAVRMAAGLAFSDRMPLEEPPN
jgi:hypothetical protein